MTQTLNPPSNAPSATAAKAPVTQLNTEQVNRYKRPPHPAGGRR